MRKIGLHLQIEDSLVACAERAMRLQLKFFQCFLSLRSAGRVISFKEDDIAQFVSLRRQHFDELYLHSSYWVNLCDVRRKRHPLLERELELAKRLEFTHIVLHAGSARGARNKSESIKALARSINRLLAHDHGLTVLLENTAHGGMAVGSDLRDFKELLKRVERPEKLKFCIDIAHAYLFGYDVVSKKGLDDFMALVDDIMGWKNVLLIHMNDTKEAFGSKIDQHYIPGEGTIGDDALKRFIFHSNVQHIPVLMEVPMLPEPVQEELIKKVSQW
ncbi:deoxyribonuclease IV [Candidatus Dependentiae bacterium]